MTTSKSIQIITFISLIIDLLGFTVILPLFPALLEYYSKNDSSGLYSSLQNSILTFESYIGVPKSFNSVLFGGLLGSLFSLLQFISCPITGALSDIYGRKPLIIGCLIGVCVSYATWMVASNFAIFVLARIIGGLSKGNVSLSYSIMTDVSDMKNRSKGMALIGIAFSIGFIIGPIVGVTFSRRGSTGWFSDCALYALVLSVANVCFVYAYFKETLPQSKYKKSLSNVFSNAWQYINPVSIFGFRPVAQLQKKESRELQQLGLVYFLYLFIYSGLEFTVTFLAHHKHGFTSACQGKMFFYLGVIMALVQGGYVRRMESGKEKKMALMGLSGMIPSFIVIGLSTTTVFLYVGLTMYAVGSSLLVPCLTALASKQGPSHQKGTLMGLWRSIGALARALGPVVASFCFWSIGCEWAYCLGGVMLFLPLGILYRS